MAWDVIFHDDFEIEFDGFREDVQNQAFAVFGVLEQFGPTLGRPHADTLNGSGHGNMKELRFNVGGEVWRVAFAFDPDRAAVLLVAGDKAGQNQENFYANLIAVADQRFEAHLRNLKDN